MNASPTMIAGYLALFVGFGFAFLFVNLLVGKFLRPKAPNPEKLEIYECGEPTIGSSFVQFDIRFYVVALLFIIFDVEIAFFFPWANVFGKATHLMDPAIAAVQTTVSPTGSAGGTGSELPPAVKGLYREMSVPLSAAPTTIEDVRSTAGQVAWLGLIDILLFFAILMIGFAYVWRRGDLDWVRAVGKETIAEPQRITPSITVERESALSA
jgi:NADH-quinone oxidoreductase subunit A